MGGVGGVDIWSGPVRPRPSGRWPCSRPGNVFEDAPYAAIVCTVA
ncbi:hypothetical protein SAMN05192564_104139 [Paraburkholderia sartisoli]|uniref:Uncharacterized protein n=1 Tax=Paraburkholderia sartisoli TaxID=83784 RepID=A0A1H4F7D2_9BURK|nr:hypothetical protein SAMN05192564_104139 [Paraburkholderia sartisoli]